MSSLGLENEFPTLPVAQIDRKLTIFSWIATILISSLPDILWANLIGDIPTWLSYAKMGLLAGVILAVCITKPLRPLRNIFVVMFAFFGLLDLFARFDFTIPAPTA